MNLINTLRDLKTKHTVNNDRKRQKLGIVNYSTCTYTYYILCDYSEM